MIELIIIGGIIWFWLIDSNYNLSKKLELHGLINESRKLEIDRINMSESFSDHLDESSKLIRKTKPNKIFRRGYL